VCDLGVAGTHQLSALWFLQPRRLDDIAGTPLYEPAALALSAARSFRPATAALQLRAGAGASAPARPRRAIHAGCRAACTVEWPDRALELETQANKALSTRLLATVGHDAAYSWELVDRFPVASHDHVPPCAVVESQCAFPHWLANTPFRHRFEPDHTAAVPRPPPQPPPPAGFCPRALKDLIMPAALHRLADHLRRAAADLLDMRAGRPVQRRVRAPYICTQDEVFPRARGIIWDLRPAARDARGCLQPLDFEAPVESHLNLEFLRVELAAYPDQALVSHLTTGVNFQVDLPLTCVLFPHLTSLPAGFTGVDKEIRKFIERGWYSEHFELPFFPMRAVGQGSTPRKLEPDRPRRTSDGGQPRRPLVPPDGIPIPALNDAIRASGTLPKEVKPRTDDKMFDDAILIYAGRFVFDEPVYQFSDDIKSFFNQLALAPHELWHSCHVWINAGEGQRAAVVSERVLGFGIAASSNIAQRLAWAMMDILQRWFDAEEDALFAELPQGKRRSWLEGRRALSQHTGRNEARLYSVWMYTDDIAFSIVGAERTHRLVRCWRRLTTTMGLEMASAAKRHIGTNLVWLGIIYNSILGTAVIPADKRARALEGVRGVAAGVVTNVSDFQRLEGLLQHLRPFAGLGRDAMHGFADACRAGGVSPGRPLGPSEPIVIRPFLRERARVWARALTETSAVSYMTAVSNQPAPPATTVWALFSDAAKERASPDESGIGGFFHGNWWSLTLADAGLLDLDLPIPVLELLAVAINVITAQPLVADAPVAIYTDSLTSADVLQRNSARSTLMQYVLTRLYDSIAYRQMEPYITVSHCYGEGNPLADAASRSKFATLAAGCRALGVQARRLALSETALAFVRDVAEYARTLSPAERGLTPAFSATEAGDGPIGPGRAVAGRRRPRGDRAAAVPAAKARPPADDGGLPGPSVSVGSSAGGHPAGATAPRVEKERRAPTKRAATTGARAADGPARQPDGVARPAAPHDEDN